VTENSLFPSSTQRVDDFLAEVDSIDDAKNAVRSLDRKRDEAAVCKERTSQLGDDFVRRTRDLDSLLSTKIWLAGSAITAA
jgi:hypothetical protein